MKPTRREGRAVCPLGRRSHSCPGRTLCSNTASRLRLARMMAIMMMVARVVMGVMGKCCSCQETQVLAGKRTRCGCGTRGRLPWNILCLGPTCVVEEDGDVARVVVCGIFGFNTRSTSGRATKPKGGNILKIVFVRCSKTYKFAEPVS